MKQLTLNRYSQQSTPWKYFILGILLLWLDPPQTIAQPTVSFDDFSPIISKIQSLVETSDRRGFLSLLAPDADLEAARTFVNAGFHEGITHAVVRATFLLPLQDIPEGSGYQLTVEVFTETGDLGRLQTWQLVLVRTNSADQSTGAWQIADYWSVDTIEGLYHLKLEEKQFDATDLVITSEDMTLRMSEGLAFISEIDNGITGLVLTGKGTLVFSPGPNAERKQVEIFSGEEILETEFTHAFVRLNPEALEAHVSTENLIETTVNKRRFNKAKEIFHLLAPLTLTIDLGDLSQRTWWITPSVGNFIAEVQTNRHGELTYIQAQHQFEDVSLFKRDPQRIVSLYPSELKRKTQGKYYGEQDLASYDILNHEVRASFEPKGFAKQSLNAPRRPIGCWIEGVARLTLRTEQLNLTSLMFRLADELQVYSVISQEFGPLLFFRMTGQNNIVINFPDKVPLGTELKIVVRYAGLLAPDEIDETWIGRARFLEDTGQMPETGVAEHRYLYSNASYWYPQSVNSDFSSATMNLTVPTGYDVVASGEPYETNPLIDTNEKTSETQNFSFTTLQPIRYLSCLITRFAPDEIPTRYITLEHESEKSPVTRSGESYDRLSLSVKATRYSQHLSEKFLDKSNEILDFYASLIGDIPYPTFTLALSDSYLPGGHSPAYFVVLNQPLPTYGSQIRSWGGDPVAFSSYPSFFLAHELAHQWWGQAIGWKNYHEQWLSEGLSQYFAVLYAQKEGGNETFQDVLAQLRRWSIRHSAQGPVYLGNRLGQINEDSTVFRALVYNKGALVLHMLRRSIGDDAFFNGLRRFYNEMRFQLAGTDDLIRAFEFEANRSLENFFERWIHEFDFPTLRFDYWVEESPAGKQSQSEVVLRLQQEGKLFEVPVTVTLKYRSGSEQTIVLPVTERTNEFRVSLTDRLRRIDINKDNAALVEIKR